MEDNHAFNKSKLQSQMERLDNLYSKFSPEFEDKVRTNPLAQMVFDSLLHGVDVYALLEQVIDITNKQQEQMKTLIERIPPSPIFVGMTKEQQDNWLSK